MCMVSSLLSAVNVEEHRATAVFDPFDVLCGITIFLVQDFFGIVTCCDNFGCISAEQVNQRCAERKISVTNNKNTFI